MNFGIDLPVNCPGQTDVGGAIVNVAPRLYVEVGARQFARSASVNSCFEALGRLG